MPPLAHSRPAEGTRFPTPANRPDVIWLVAEEVPVAFEYNRRAHAVMMATPADLEDFALGFSLCEGILASADDVDGIRVRHAADGIVLSIAADPLKLLTGSLRRRSMEGRSGCGLCGVDSLANVLRPPRPVAASFTPDAGAVAAAFARLPDHQPMNRANRSLHATASAPTGLVLTLAHAAGMTLAARAPGDGVMLFR